MSIMMQRLVDQHNCGWPAIALAATSFFLEELDQVERQSQEDADEDNIKAEMPAGPHLQQMARRVRGHCGCSSQAAFLPSMRI